MKKSRIENIDEIATKSPLTLFLLSVAVAISMSIHNWFNCKIFLVTSLVVFLILASNRLAEKMPSLVFVGHATALTVMAYFYGQFSAGNFRAVSLLNVAVGGLFALSCYGFFMKLRGKSS